MSESAAVANEPKVTNASAAARDNPASAEHFCPRRRRLGESHEVAVPAFDKADQATAEAIVDGLVKRQMPRSLRRGQPRLEPPAPGSHDERHASGQSDDAPRRRMVSASAQAAVEQPDQLIPVPFGGGFVVHRAVPHGPSMRGAHVEVVAMVDAGFHQRLAEAASHLGWV